MCTKNPNNHAKLHKYQTSSSYNEHLCVPRIPTTMQSYINIKRAVHTMNTYVYQESQQPCKVTNIKRAVHTMNTYVYQESQQPCKVT